MTDRQHKFCIAYIETRNPREASLKAGYSPAYSKTKSYALLKNPAIKEKIDYLSKEYYQSEFQKLALDAVKTLSDVLADDQNRAIQLQSVKYILHEAGIADQPDSDSGTIQIKIRLPKELE